jgi:pilus assembly protein Flp/PilA
VFKRDPNGHVFRIEGTLFQILGGGNVSCSSLHEQQGLVEYALILVLVAVVVIAILLIVGPVVGNVFSNLAQNL